MLVLASASPRRQDLLRQAGVVFAVQASNIAETPSPGEQPRALAERLAREKALAVFRERPRDSVLGADTIVVVDQTVLGKPSHAEEAKHMLTLLSGRSHLVITGVCLVVPSNRAELGEGQGSSPGVDLDSEATVVYMQPLAESEISAYVASGEPADKAGGYAIQGWAARWIYRIEGDYSNVVGLPVAKVCAMLRRRNLL
jgi:septum formation protein